MKITKLLKIIFSPYFISVLVTHMFMPLWYTWLQSLIQINACTATNISVIPKASKLINESRFPLQLYRYSQINFNLCIRAALHVCMYIKRSCWMWLRIHVVMTKAMSHSLTKRTISTQLTYIECQKMLDPSELGFFFG